MLCRDTSAITGLRLSLTGVMFLMVSATSVYGANGVCEGTISGQALKPLPDNTPFDIDIYDNSEENLALREQFLKVLNGAGHNTADGGPLVINVSSELLFPRYRRDTRSVGRTTTGAGINELGVNKQRTTIENMQFPQRDRTKSGSSRFEEQVDVRLEVRDTQTREFVWLAQLSCTPVTEDRSEIIRVVLEALAKALGKTLKAQQL